MLKTAKPTKEVRLSKYVLPIEYDIELQPDMENFVFSGLETIHLSISKPADTLTLHSKEIDIEAASILIGDDKVFAKKISYNEKDEIVNLKFSKEIPRGKTKLALAFKGILNDKMRGFYRSKYSVGGKEFHMATTQFEATDARRAFPCFDEPAQKAVFNVSLIVPKGKTAISNTLPISVEEHEGEFEIVRFSPTPKMSTYLLAFIVGDFEYIEMKSKRGVKVRVYTTPGKKHQADFALQCAVKTLDFYESYFDIHYPLPVLDMIAIPDFASGAMENWGAITYRESALLVDEKHSSVGNKQWVALVIAHELAHQWFGNLVTMEWWTHLWLNEGFASYIEYLAIDKLFPKWDIWTQFSAHEQGTALRLDSLKHTHPIEIPVHHPDEIGEIFDEVSYSKGASVIRMLAGYLGEKNFRDGLRYYLKKHSYKNTETIHLWQAFEKVSGKKVATMMHNWTSKPGYPVINAEKKNGKVIFTQSRFFSSPISKRQVKDSTIWQVPIIYKNNKVNFGESGFFRVAYSKDLLTKLRGAVENKTLSARDRLGVIRDLFALSEAGIVPTTFALEFLEAYKREDNYTVWLEIASGLARVEQLFAKTPAKKNLDQYILKLFTPIHKKLGWSAKKNDAHTDSLLRSLVISRLGRSGDMSVVKSARTHYEKIKKGQRVNPDIRGAIYATIAANGNKKDFESFITHYKKETLHEEKNRVGYVLGDFADPKLLELTCAFSVSKEVRTQDTMGIIGSVAANPLGRDIWLSFIKKNWKMLVTRYGDGGHQLARLVKAISASPEQKHLIEFKNFFHKNQAPGAKRAVLQVLERLESNTLWLKRDQENIQVYLSTSSQKDHAL